jgi:hypothetical protein
MIDWKEAFHFAVRIGIVLGIFYICYWMTTTQSREATMWEKFGQSRFAAVQACAEAKGEARYFCEAMPTGIPFSVNDSSDWLASVFGHGKQDKICVNTATSGVVCDDSSEWPGNVT